MLPDPLQTIPDSLIIQAFQHGNKLIASVASHKMFSRDSFTKKDGKRPDVLITFLMSQVIVNGSEIIKVKNADRNVLLSFGI